MIDEMSYATQAGGQSMGTPDYAASQQYGSPVAGAPPPPPLALDAVISQLQHLSDMLNVTNEHAAATRGRLLGRWPLDPAGGQTEAVSGATVDMLYRLCAQLLSQRDDLNDHVRDLASL